MTEDQVRFLIANWSIINQTFSTWFIDEADYALKQRQPAPYVLRLGRKREHWEVFLCLIAYASHVSSTTDFSGSEAIDIINLPENTDDLVVYSHNLTDLPSGRFRSVLQNVKKTIEHQRTFTPVEETPITTLFNSLEICLKLHPNNPEALKNCILGQNQLDEEQIDERE